MAYIVASHGCCHCKGCWNIADVPHETRGVIFTVRWMDDDGYEYHLIQEGFATHAAAEAALKEKRKSRG